MNRILSRYIITDIVNIICHYIGKYRLQHIKSIQLEYKVDFFLTHKENVYFTNDETICEITNNDIKSYVCPLRPYNILNKDIVLTRNPFRAFKIFNIKTSRVIQNIYNVEETYIASNKKYMVLADDICEKNRSIKIYDINKMTCLHNGIINCFVSNESVIEGNIIYLVDLNKPKIYKYTTTGKYLGYVEFNKLDRDAMKIKILSTEMIIMHKSEITYHDYDGNLQGMVRVNEEIEKFTATPNHIYTVNGSNMLNIYKRIL